MSRRDLKHCAMLKAMLPLEKVPQIWPVPSPLPLPAGMGALLAQS